MTDQPGSRTTSEPVIEIRTYLLKPGERAAYHRILRDEGAPLLEQFGIEVVAHGPSLLDDDHYFLVRAYPSLAARDAAEARVLRERRLARRTTNGGAEPVDQLPRDRPAGDAAVDLGAAGCAGRSGWLTADDRWAAGRRSVPSGAPHRSTARPDLSSATCQACRTARTATRGSHRRVPSLGSRGRYGPPARATTRGQVSSRMCSGILSHAGRPWRGSPRPGRPSSHSWEPRWVPSSMPRCPPGSGGCSSSPSSR